MEELLARQLLLAQAGKIGFSDSEQMSVKERDLLIDMIQKKQREESQSMGSEVSGLPPVMGLASMVRGR